MRLNAAGTIDHLYENDDDDWGSSSCGVRAGAIGARLRRFSCEDDAWSAEEYKWEVRAAEGFTFLLVWWDGDNEPPLRYVAAPPSIQIPNDPCAGVVQAECVLR